MDDDVIRSILGNLACRPWEGTVFRHMFADYPPDRENRRGARWNPPDIPAIYTSLDRSIALAEADYHINLQPVRPKAKRTIYRVKVRLNAVLDLTDRSVLDALALKEFPSDPVDHSICQCIGGAAEFLGSDGLLIPSARGAGNNLVIYPNRAQRDHYAFEVLDHEMIAESTLPAKIVSFQRSTEEKG